MEEKNEYLQALIQLHQGLERQGPGDLDFSNHILSSIKELPPSPRIVDFGCGTGTGALFLAEKFELKVKAVDLSKEFLGELNKRAKQRGLEHLVETIQDDMGNLDWKTESIDLLWSEGAAYNLTFKGALKAWRPLMSVNGIAVISEMSYFASEVPEPVKAYWKEAYPDMATESENAEHAKSLGFDVLSIQRLPSKAWWDNYYEPLKKYMEPLKRSKNEATQSVVKETEEEIKLFEEYEEFYGYSFYVMKVLK